MSQYLKIALIPAYNPEECLIQVVQQLSEKGFWILIVDDGSDKEHKPIFQEIDDAGNVLILPHETNKGKGSALKTGMAYIQIRKLCGSDCGCRRSTQSKRCRNGMERG